VIRRGGEDHIKAEGEVVNHKKKRRVRTK